MDAVFASLQQLIVLLCPFGIFLIIIIVWVLAFNAFFKAVRAPDARANLAGNLVRYILTPVTVTVFVISIPLMPFLAIAMLVLAVVLFFLFYPLSLLVRGFPTLLRDMLRKAEIFSAKIFHLDDILITGLQNRFIEVTRSFVGILGSAIIGFPPLINWGMHRLNRSTYVRERMIRDIRFIERLLRADIAADLLIAIAQDPRHRESSRIEAVRLLRELGRPIEDLLHIITIPRIDPKIAIEAAYQAEQILAVNAIEQNNPEGSDNRAIPIWERLAAHPHPEPRLNAAEKLYALNEVNKALGVLYGLMADSKNNSADYRARAARQLYETGLRITDDEIRAQELAKAEQYLELMTRSRNPRERLEGAAAIVRLKGADQVLPETVKTILDLLDDANLDPVLRHHTLDLLAELNLVNELRYAIEKRAPTPEQEWEQRIDAIKAMEKVHSEEAVKYWAELAAQPGLPTRDAHQALSSIRRLCSDTPDGAGWTKAEINTIEVQQGFGALRELGSNQEMPATLRLEAADTLEALEQIKDANAIYYVLQNDPTVDKRINRKAANAVRRLDRLILVNRPGRTGSPEA